LPESVVINYDSTARTITLTGTVTALWRCQIIAALVSGWESEPHDDTVGFWYLSFDGSNFVWSNLIWTFDLLQIAYVNYGAVNRFGLGEAHGLMGWQTHRELHENIGTYKNSGGTITGVVPSSTTAAQRRPIVAQTVIGDEDINTTNLQLASSLYTRFFLSSTGVGNYTVETAEIIPLLGNNPYYNAFASPNWIQTLFANNSCGTVWLVGVPVTKDINSQNFRFLFVQPQWNTLAISGSAGNLLAARNIENARTPNELNLSALGITEYVIFARFCVQYTASNWTIEKVTYLTGNKYNQTANPAGNFITGINTSGKLLTGTGTSANPLIAKNLNGFIDYSDAATQLVPITYTNGEINLPNDGAGVYSTKVYTPDGITDLYNVATGQFKFSELSLGDEIAIRYDLVVTTSAINQEFNLKMLCDIGGNPYYLHVGSFFYKTAAAHNICGTLKMYIGNAGTLANPAELRFSSVGDDNADIVINGYYISTYRRN